jgi:hypothetical protein
MINRYTAIISSTYSNIVLAFVYFKLPKATYAIEVPDNINFKVQSTARQAIHFGLLNRSYFKGISANIELQCMALSAVGRT